MPLAADDFDDLVSSMGLAGTAAANLDDIMARLAASTHAAEAAARAEAAAARVAAGTGVSVAEVKKALAAANAEAAASAKAAAAEQAAAAKEAAAAEREAAKERAAAARAAAAEQAAAAREAAREEKAAAREAAAIQREADREAKSQAAAQAAERAAKSEARKKAAQEAAAARAEAQKTAAAEAAASRAARQQAIDTFAHTAATQGLTAAMGPYGQAVDIVIQRVTFLASKLYDLAQAAVTLTQEKDALRDTFDVFTGGAGDELLGDLEELASKLPYTGDQLNAWAKSLLQAGIAGDALKTSVQAIAASAAITKTAGTAAEGLIKRFAMAAQTGQQVALDRRILDQLAEAGVLTADLAKALGVAPEKLAGMKVGADKLGEAMQQALIAKGAKSLAVVGQSVTSIAAKLKEGWEDAFEDLGDIVGPFMGELRSLASEFFAGSIASGVLKDGIRGLLTPAFEVATKAVRGMHIAFLQIEIAYLKAAIALQPLTSAIDKFIPKGTAATVIFEAMKVAFIIAAAAAVVFGVAMFIALLPLMVLVGAVALVVYAFYRLGSALYDEASMFLAMGAAVASAGKSVVSSVLGMVAGVAGALVGFPLTAAEAGVNFVTGLIQAITSGQGPVADAVRQLARGAISAITGAFQTRSPSRVTAKIGGYFTEGLAGGIDDGAGDVEAAAGGAGDAAVGGLKSGMRKGSGKDGQRKGDGAGPTFNFNNCQFGDGMSKALVIEIFQEAWEQMAGEGPDPEPAT